MSWPRPGMRPSHRTTCLPRGRDHTRGRSSPPGGAAQEAVQGTCPFGVHGSQTPADSLDPRARADSAVVEVPEQGPVDSDKAVADQGVAPGQQVRSGAAVTWVTDGSPGGATGAGAGRVAAPGDLARGCTVHASFCRPWTRGPRHRPAAGTVMVVIAAGEPRWAGAGWRDGGRRLAYRGPKGPHGQPDVRLGQVRVM